MTASFEDWRRELGKLGFEALGTGGRKGTHLGREVGPFQQAIGVVVADHRQGAFNVQLNVNMDLRCAEPPHRVVVLTGDLAPDGVRVFEPWTHDPAHATWWPPDQIIAAREAAVRLGVDWLDRHSDAGTLIRYFEEEHERHEAGQAALRSEGWLRMLRLKASGRPVQRSAHDEYLLWLAMLYEVDGSLEQARDCLDQYAVAVEARGLRTESARLDRHRAHLAGLSNG